MMLSSAARPTTGAGAKSFVTRFCLLMLLAMPVSSANAVELQPVYNAVLSNGSLAPSLDSLGVGDLQPGFTLASADPTFTFSGDGTTVSLTRPTDPTLVGPVGAGLFATPVSFGKESVFALQATFLAPNGPHDIGNVWAAAVGARTGDQDDLAQETRVAATFQVRAGGARLNVVGATAPANQLNLAQPIYDSIFDPNNPEPFTLYLLVNRATGNGTAKLTVGSYTTSVDFLLADFQPNAGPPITAVGPSIAVSNGPGRTASITVRDFWVFSAVPEPGSWATMLLGFGAIGLSTRASRHVVSGTNLRRIRSNVRFPTHLVQASSGGRSSIACGG